MAIDAIIQARMGSTRLPGKVLMKLDGIPVLKCLIEQLSYSELIDRKIIATSTNPDDDMIVEFAKSLNVESFRGSSLNVLDRYYQCARHFSIKHIVRITADNPLIDPEIIDKVIKVYQKGNFDYVNNFTRRTYPSGTEVEVFSFNSLSKAWKNAKLPYEKEHVTPYIYNNPKKFSIGYVEHDVDLSKFSWSIDRMEDLKFVTALCKEIKKKPILLKDILNVIKKNPSIIKISKR